MAKRGVKKRTHTGGAAPAPGNKAGKPGSRTPKSMVIRIGASEVGPSISQLVHDVRTMMEPETAVRLKERRNNKLRDYTTMAGELGVTHLLLFSRNSGSGNVNMRLAVTPRGPTFHFRVEKYSLCKDVLKSQKRPRSAGPNEYLAAPLLVMNNFSIPTDEAADMNGAQQHKIPKKLESLTTSVFQSLFPPINPTNTPLKNIKRILLLDRAPTEPTSDSAQYTLNLRHYAIETRTAKSVPKPLRKLDAAEKASHAGQKRKRGSGIPNLGKLNDVAEYLLDPQAAEGFTSGSDSEADTDAEVEVLAPTSQKVQNRHHAKKDSDKPESAPAPDRRRGPNVEKKGIKLHELGPRLRIRLTKVEEGLCGGKVMWHEYIHKSETEVKEMETVHKGRRAEKERRKREQKENVERKKKERGENGKADGEGDEDMEEDEWDDYEDDEMVDGGVEDEEADEDMEDEEGGGYVVKNIAANAVARNGELNAERMIETAFTFHIEGSGSLKLSWRNITRRKESDWQRTDRVDR
ncbi:rRNA-binding ribosome biosynthesis protein [Vermiconidia calcicola]|uniref:rRNA-binding ribosome biosynthesis protein n=1 Tax=Vermiconidia calcicola TaxID=1690605 RepID=A0ACC3MIJ2_9PEZI|nr:rRNA-binding ribosome biosynthesis protein [Vermiconidia calcicola]